MSEETTADILAEMFDFSDKRIEEGRDHAMTSESVGLIVHQLAKRFGAAWKRESAGNAAAMRVALENLTRFAEVDIRGLENLAKYAIDHSMYGGGVLRAVAGAIREGKNALSAPARNCDLPNTTERYNEFCYNHRDAETCCEKCPFNGSSDCEAEWLLAHAEKGGAE